MKPELMYETDILLGGDGQSNSQPVDKKIRSENYAVTIITQCS